MVVIGNGPTATFAAAISGMSHQTALISDISAGEARDGPSWPLGDVVRHEPDDQKDRHGDLSGGIEENLLSTQTGYGLGTCAGGLIYARPFGWHNPRNSRWLCRASRWLIGRRPDRVAT